MDSIKQTLLSNWNFMRWFRLAAGIFIGIQAITHHDTLFGFLAAFFLFQAITNTGCCGARGCSVPSTNTSREASVQDAEFEEVK